MNKVAALSLSLLLISCPTVFGQDAMLDLPRFSGQFIVLVS